MESSTKSQYIRATNPQRSPGIDRAASHRRKSITSENQKIKISEESTQSKGTFKYNGEVDGNAVFLSGRWSLYSNNGGPLGIVFENIEIRQEEDGKEKVKSCIPFNVSIRDVDGITFGKATSTGYLAIEAAEDLYPKDQLHRCAVACSQIFEKIKP